MTDQTQPLNSATAEPSSGGPTDSGGGFDVAALAHERPEVVIGAAFAGGFLLATILKRLAG